MPTDTPRTDAVGTPYHGYVRTSFARELERENAELRRGIKILANCIEFPTPDLNAKRIAADWRGR